VRKLTGITENYWNELHEDKRLFWKLLTRTLGLFSGIIVTKTGITSIDWILGSFATLFPMLVIESQRSYKKFSPKLRKSIVRLCIFLGSWSIALLGIAFFTQIGFVVVVGQLGSVHLPRIEGLSSEFIDFTYLTFFVVMPSIAVLKTFRETEFEKLIYHLPNDGLRKLLIYRPFDANNLFLFAYFELVVMGVCYMYSSTVAATTTAFITVLNIK